MVSPQEFYLFDASNYPGFEKTRVLERRFRRPDPGWYEGLATAALFVVMIAFFIVSGIASDQPLVFASLVAVAVGISIAFILLVHFTANSVKNPVRITSDGRLLLGEKSWSVARIGRITAFGHAGAVEITEKGGRVIARPYRAQFGSFDDFIETVQRIQPDVEVVRQTTNVKIRLPKDSI